MFDVIDTPQNNNNKKHIFIFPLKKHFIIISKNPIYGIETLM